MLNGKGEMEQNNVSFYYRRNTTEENIKEEKRNIIYMNIDQDNLIYNPLNQNRLTQFVTIKGKREYILVKIIAKSYRGIRLSL